MDNMLGIVGGVGPYTGLDLASKIFDQTLANKDKDHLPVALLSIPEKIADRTPFVLGKSDVNPGYAIAKIILELDKMGADIIGIPCNTAHAPVIFDVILKELEKNNSSVKLIHMIKDVVQFIHEYYPELKNVGVLSTIGTHKSGIYTDLLKRYGLNVIFPDEDTLETVQDALYNKIYGIKAEPNPVTEIAEIKLSNSIESLITKGAEVVILGCTELPLALDKAKIFDCVIIDPAFVLARAMIIEFDVSKLKALKINHIEI